jgi:hypothetical protein
MGWGEGRRWQSPHASRKGTRSPGLMGEDGERSSSFISFEFGNSLLLFSSSKFLLSTLLFYTTKKGHIDYLTTFQRTPGTSSCMTFSIKSSNYSFIFLKFKRLQSLQVALV